MGETKQEENMPSEDEKLYIQVILSFIARVYQLDIAISDLEQRNVPFAQNSERDNVILIVRKNKSETEYRPYYCARIQRRTVKSKIAWCRKEFPNCEVIFEVDTPNGVNTFNRLEEEGIVDRFGCHFRLVGIIMERLRDLLLNNLRH